MKYIKYYLIILTMIIIASCSDYLDIKPKGEVIPESIDDLDRMLNAREFQYLHEKEFALLTDNYSFEGAARGARWDRGKDLDKNLYSYQPGQTYTGKEGNNTWLVAYKAIFNSSFVIENLPYANEQTEQDKVRKKEIAADARVARAEKYFILVNAYGKQYNKTTAASDLGVSIITVANVNQTVPARSSVQEVYDFILKEITDYKDDLPETTLNTFRFTKPSAAALLARIYFQMEEYTLALQYAEEALSYTDYELIDYNDSDIKPENYWLRKDTYRYTKYSGGLWYLLPGDDLLALYEQPFDLRGSIHISGSSYGESWKPLSSIDFTGLSVQEMMLVAAESEARNGELNDALDYLNEFRLNRYETGSISDLTSTDQNEVLTWIIEERRKEIPYALRLFELKRLDNDPAFAKQIVHIVTEGGVDQTYTLEINDEKFILPVPIDILSFNPNMLEYSRN